MTASNDHAPRPQARRRGIYYRCCVCAAESHMTEAKAAGWQSRRMHGESAKTWWCAEHVPADLPPPARRHRRAPRGQRCQLGERRRIKVYTSARWSASSYTFAFGFRDLAHAAGMSERWVRQEFNDGAFDPLDLRGVMRWLAACPANRAPAAPLPDYQTGAYNHFAAAGSASPVRVAAGLAELGLEVTTVPTDRRLLDVMGDKVTAGSAQRLLEHMQREGLSSVSRPVARAVMLGLVRLARLPRAGDGRFGASAAQQRRADRLVAELGAQLAGSKVTSRDAVTVLVDGLAFTLAKAADLLAALQAPTRRAQIQDALRVLSGYRAPAAAKRKKARAKVAATKRKKVRVLSGRAIAAG